ncbi:MAG: diadenylate cyclase [Planctomycetota bacterium]|jgi:diadenylate cyclase
MLNRLIQLYDSVGTRDFVQIAILAVVIFGVLRVLGRSGAGSSIGRGLSLVVVALFLLAQVIVASLDLTELGVILDYVLITVSLALVILFQPEIRRGLIKLGRSRFWRNWTPTRHAIADPLADAAEALSRDGIGALIAIQREVDLTSYIESGERIDGKLSAPLMRTLFAPKCPLHDGAVILVRGRIAAAGCQLPMRPHHEREASGAPTSFGMRHRAALSLSEETDAIILVISEETGRISLASGGRFEPVPRENLARRLVDLLHAPSIRDAA